MSSYKGLRLNWQVQSIIIIIINNKHLHLRSPSQNCFLGTIDLPIQVLQFEMRNNKQLRSANWPITNSTFETRQNNVEYFAILHSSKC